MIAAGPVIPNFGQASSCVLENRTFCWGWAKQHWGDTLGPALAQHLELTAIAVGIGFVLAFALALLAHRVRAVEQPIGVVSALLYTIPSLALFQLLVPFTGITTTTVEIALVAYTLVILFPNIVAGLRSAPPEVLEAARGMGLTRQAGAAARRAAARRPGDRRRPADRRRLDDLDRHDRRVPASGRARLSDLQRARGADAVQDRDLRGRACSRSRSRW